jgi:hypothetical protein
MKMPKEKSFLKPKKNKLQSCNVKVDGNTILVAYR